MVTWICEQARLSRRDPKLMHTDCSQTLPLTILLFFYRAAKMDPKQGNHHICLYDDHIIFCWKHILAAGGTMAGKAKT